MDTKYIHHIHPHSPFPCAHPSPTGTCPQKRFIFPSCFSFLFFFLITCILVIPGVSPWYFRSIYHAFIKLTPSPPLLTHSQSPCSPNVQQLSVQCIVLYSHIDGLFQGFSFSNIFFLSPTSHSPLRQTH
jgi:hypothetical protein